MGPVTMTLEEFTLRARRAGLELDLEEIEMLYQRVKARLSPASEPAHLFRPHGAPVDERR